MKYIGKAIKVLVLVLGIILIGLIAIPFIFKDKIVDYTKEALNSQVNAQVNFESADLSLLSSFPMLSLEIGGIEIKDENVSDLDGKDLLQCKNAFLSFNFIDIFKDINDIKIKKIRVEGAEIYVNIDESGKANYNIFPESGEESTAKESSWNGNLALESYEILDSKIKYIDEPTGIKFQLANLDHTGSGDFNLDIFDFKTITEADSIYLNFGGIDYLKNVRVNSVLDLLANTNENTFTLKNNELSINDLKVKALGSVALLEKATKLDLSLETPKSQFRDVLSLIPSLYQKDFDKLTASGNFNFNGLIKGMLGPGDIMPSFTFDASIDDGAFKYEDFPEGVSGLNAKINIDQPKSSLNDMIVEVSPFNFLLAKKKNAGKIRLSDLLTNPKFVGDLKGSLSLEDLKGIVQIEGLDYNGGLMNYETQFDGDQLSVVNEDFDQIKLEGKMDLDRAMINYGTYPQVNLTNLSADFNSDKIVVNETNVKAGNTDLNSSMIMNNPLAILVDDAKPHLEVKLKGKSLNVDDWMIESAPSEDVSVSESGEPIVVPVSASIDANFDKVEAMSYTLNQFTSKMTYENSRLDILSFLGFFDGTKYDLKGSLQNVEDYLNKSDILIGNLSGDLGSVNLNTYLEDQGEKKQSSAEAVAAEFKIPKDINLSLDLGMKEVELWDYNASNLALKSEVANGKMIVEDGSGRFLGGDIGLAGLVETPDNEVPKMDMSLNMNLIDYNKVYESVSSFKKIAPLVQYLQGKFNMDLDFKASLNKDMSLDLNSINAEGFLQTINTVLKGYDPIREISKKYGISDLSNFDITDTKNWLTISNGAVNLKESKHVVKGTDYFIGGRHAIEGDMDYFIKTSLPIKALANQAGLSGGLSSVLGQLDKLGLNSSQAEYVDVQFNLTGVFQKPKVSFKVLGLSGKGGDSGSLTDNVKDEIVDRAKEEKEKLKQQIEDEKKKREQELRNKMDEEKRKLEDLKNKKEEEIRQKIEEEKKKKEKEIKDRIEREKNEKEEELKKKLEEEKQKLKDKLGGLKNPF